jgi:hypothetical protein
MTDLIMVQRGYPTKTTIIKSIDRRHDILYTSIVLWRQLQRVRVQLYAGFYLQGNHSIRHFLLPTAPCQIIVIVIH